MDNWPFLVFMNKLESTGVAEYPRCSKNLTILPYHISLVSVEMKGNLVLVERGYIVLKIYIQNHPW